MEEEEGGYGDRGAGGWEARQRPYQGFHDDAPAASPRGEPAAPARSPAMEELIRLLTEERRKILDNDKFTAKEKLALLDDNRKAIVVASGGSVRKTENVVYGLLVFGSVGLIVLALLTTYAGLPHEVTLSFVGTVLGGTIATIAQKLGNL